MKTLITALVSSVLLGLTPNASANEKITQGYKTYDSMGCMLLRECVDGVRPVHTMLDISSNFSNPEIFTSNALEFNNMLSSLNRVGVNVFLSDGKYFPPGHRGVYHTVGNNFFLNIDYMHRPGVLMSVLRHEGWHAAQDCMAGTIKNSLVAIIKPEESVPAYWREMTERTYPSAAVPWEAEATWAGKTAGMTMDALASCARGDMWTTYPPTPKTGEWLKENGYID